MNSPFTPFGKLPSPNFLKASVAVLGLNIWVALTLAPAFFAGAVNSGLFLTLAAVALATLGLGLWIRNEWLLLLGFPSACFCAVGLRPRLLELVAGTPSRAVLLTVLLLTYLASVLLFTANFLLTDDGKSRPLTSARVRRPHEIQEKRILTSLFAFCLASGLGLVLVVGFHSGFAASLERLYPDREIQMQILLLAGALGLWLATFVYVVLGLSKRVRISDPELTVQLSADARRKTLWNSPRVWLAATCAVSLLFLWHKLRVK